MIATLDNASRRSIDADICIIGSGAAGLSLAAEFLNTHWRVCVIESGGRHVDTQSESLNAAVSVGVRHDGWRDGRTRAYGGTTRAWGGQLLRLKAGEMAVRDWVAESGWPMALDELEPYYRRAERLLDVEGPPYDDAVWRRLGLQPLQMLDADLTTRFSQWARIGRRNFAVFLGPQLERAANIEILLHATAVHIDCNAASARVNRLEVRARSGASCFVRAAHYVLATGAIETARLLLASRGPSGAGIANSSGLVGRYLQDHVSYVAGEIVPASRKAFQHVFDPRFSGRTMHSVKIEPDEPLMQERHWLSAVAHVSFLIPEALGWMEARRLLRDLQRGELTMPSGREILALLRGAGELSRLAVGRMVGSRRRSPAQGRILLLVDCEQAPQHDSRVTLDTRCDAMGRPLPRIDWRISGIELRTLTQYAQHVADWFETTALGSVQLAPAPDFAARDVLGAARDVYHQLGTARMSDDPKRGVTDRNLRCHDLSNLHVAGSAVFPIGGIANPTLTILALSLRLADRLKLNVAPGANM